MKKDIIVSGLEDLRSISDDSDGTVYLAKRTKEVGTVVKVLPYSLYLELKDDSFTLNYLKESKKLRALSQVPNIHLAKIHQIGLTGNDHYPFIESELITGPDLEKLLTFPNNSIFRIEEVINLSLQLADALAHCHSAMVTHGSLNINNIRFNSETGQYVLVNFGRCMLTDKQRMIEVEQARSVEFLAPEQIRGELLLETDVYSLGLVLFQALTGSVPQNITSSISKSAEKPTHLHLTIPEQIEKSRADNLPINWTKIEKDHEMDIPVWLTKLITVSLDPEKRYRNGILFKEAIHAGRSNISGLSTGKSQSDAVESIDNKASFLMMPAVKDDSEKEVEIKRLKSLIIQKDGQLDVLRYQTAGYNPDSNKLSISKPIFFTLLALLALFGILTVYSYFIRKADTSGRTTTYTDEGSSTGDTSKNNYRADMYSDSLNGTDSAALLNSIPSMPEEEPAMQNVTPNLNEENKKPDVTKPISGTTPVTESKPKKRSPVRSSASTNTKSSENELSENAVDPPVNRVSRYTQAVGKAYFYDEPDVRSRRPVYMVDSDESEFTATNDSNGFIYVVFFNTDKQITRGWLRKQDLRKIN